MNILNISDLFLMHYIEKYQPLITNLDNKFIWKRSATVSANLQWCAATQWTTEWIKKTNSSDKVSITWVNLEGWRDEGRGDQGRGMMMMMMMMDRRQKEKRLYNVTFLLMANLKWVQLSDTLPHSVNTSAHQDEPPPCEVGQTVFVPSSFPIFSFSSSFRFGSYNKMFLFLHVSRCLLTERRQNEVSHLKWFEGFSAHTVDCLWSDSPQWTHRLLVETYLF